ncbi:MULTISPECIES: helix-turn-helix domain-containing protein [unclassified Sphingobium]|nr:MULTISPECIES: helix-turn-helix transcriptional regulator [unclassified Sphingobium]UXC91809.1 helix-turn-helix transcriptional regulator [Sphingobium sp. RSMS]
MPEQPIPPELEAYRAKVMLLTDRQRQCMNLVADNLNSKKIGKELRISPWTVDKHIEKARAQLGDMDRFDAARIVRAFEDASTVSALPPQNLGTQPMGLSPSPQMAPSVPVEDDADTHLMPDRTIASSQGDNILMNAIHALLEHVPLRSNRRQSNDLNIYYILIAVAMVGSGALFTAGQAASFLSALDSMARR